MEGTLSQHFLNTLSNEQLMLLAEEKHTAFVESIEKLKNKLAGMSDSQEKRAMQENAEEMIRKHDEDMQQLEFLKCCLQKN